LAVLVAISLVLFGVVPSNDVLLGLSNPATLTVLAMFILSEGIFKTGIINKLGYKIFTLSRNNLRRATVIIMLFVGITSMFINNTAAVALMIPIVMDISKRANWSPSKLLIPLSFASMFGGVCTLIGTSTNLLANSFLEAKGYKPFTMFSFTSQGLIFFFVGFIFIFLVGKKLIPSRRVTEDLTDIFELNNYLLDVKVLAGNPLIGKNINDNEMLNNYEIVNIINSYSDVVSEGDILRVRLDVEGIREVFAEEDFKIMSRKNITDKDFDSNTHVLVEAVIGPRSPLITGRIVDLKLHKNYSAKILSIRQHNYIEHRLLSTRRLEAGDTLLLSVRKDKLKDLDDTDYFTLLLERSSYSFNRSKTWAALSIFVGVLLAAKFSLMPIHISALLGVCFFILFKVINFEEAYRAVDWKIIFLLGGLLTLGSGMEASGTTEWISGHLYNKLLGQSDMFVVGAFFLVTMLFTAFISNNASVALMTPLAIYTAEALGADVYNLVLTVMFASSMSFMTPVGYQTNLMIFSIGRFRFVDFFKVGGPLCLIFLVLAMYVLK
jgi:di/tricarboxylate transporter